MADGQVVELKAQADAKKSRVLAVLPLSISRSALFSIAPEGPASKHRVIPTAKKGVNAAITYTGPHLNMEHFKAWQALLFLAEERGQLGGDEFTVPVSEVLKHMGKTYKDSEIKQKLFDVLTELKAAVVTIVSERVHYRSESLIDVVRMNMDTRMITAQFGRKIAAELLDREILRNDIERSRELKRHYLAIWLHGYISSQASKSDKKDTRHTFPVDELRVLCGSQAKERWHFVQDLDRALTRLKEGTNPLVRGWDWDDKRKKNKVIVTKAHTLVKLLEVTKATVAGKRHQAAVQFAASSRANVAL